MYLILIHVNSSCLQGLTEVEGEVLEPLASSVLCYAAALVYNRALAEAEASGASGATVQRAADCRQLGISGPTQQILARLLSGQHHSFLLDLPASRLQAAHAALADVAAWALSERPPQLASVQLHPRLHAGHGSFLSCSMTEEVRPHRLEESRLPLCA